MKINRHFTKAGVDVFSTVEYDKRTSRITNPDGSVVFEMTDAEVPKSWSQLATDIMVSKYFRKAGVPQIGADGRPLYDDNGNVVKGPEKSARQVIHRLAGCWRHWGETHGYFDTAEDAQAFYDELSYMLLTQRCAPNSPQWFNTGLNWAYDITGPAQGHFYCDPKTGELLAGKDAYTHPQPHACQPFKAGVSTPSGSVLIGRIVKDKLIGLEVLDGTDEGNGVTRVTAVKENGEKPVFRVVLDGGATIEATADHLVYALTSDGTTGRWVRLDSLERGTELLQSVRDRTAESALAHSPLAASFGAAAVAEVQTLPGVVRRLQPAKVRRIEPIGTMPVFDIQTESGQYLSNHVIVHNCFIQSVSDDLVNPGGIMDLWTREARLFKYGSGCTSGDSRVYLEGEGFLPLRNLFVRFKDAGRPVQDFDGKGRYIDVSDLNLRTLSVDPATGVYAADRIDRVWQYDVAADDKLTVRFDTGAKATVSAWHPFLVWNGTAIVEKRADQLGRGDTVIGPNDTAVASMSVRDAEVTFDTTHYGTPESHRVTIDADLAWLIGYFLGDGSLGANRRCTTNKYGTRYEYDGLRVRFSDETVEVLDRVREIVARIFGEAASIQQDGRGSKGKTVTFTGRRTSGFFAALFDVGPKAATLRMPEFVWEAGVELATAFLAGLVDSDGWVRDGRAIYATASHSFATEVGVLANVYGLGGGICRDRSVSKVTIVARRSGSRQRASLAAHLAHPGRRQRLVDYKPSSHERKFCMPLDNDLKEQVFGTVPVPADWLRYSVGGQTIHLGRLQYAGIVNPLKLERSIALCRAAGTMTDGILADRLTRIARSAVFVTSVEPCQDNPDFYDLTVANHSNYLAGENGLVAIHNTGSNFSKVRGENERLSGGGRSSGLMSFLKIGDRAAGAIKSGGTTRRAAKMVCLDLDHPDIESFVNWKVREELKVACLAEGIKHLPGDQKELATKLGLKLDYDFNGEAYYTVSGQNSNNSVRIPNGFFKAVEADGDWHLYNRTDGKIAKTVKARDLWNDIAFAAWRCADPGVQYDDTINQWHTCPKSGRINASNPCVTGDTRVLTPGGIWRRIDQMIHLPARLITNLYDQSINVTDGAFPTGTKDVFELTTAGGYSVKLTADHKVWTKGRGWVAASELTTADQLRLPSKPAAVHEVGEPQDPAFFQLLGLFMSDCNGHPAGLRLSACLAHTDQAESFQQYVAETWGDHVLSDYPDDYAGGATLTATVTHRRLISRLKAFVKTDTAGQRLGDEAFTAGLAAQKHMLRGLFTADSVIRDDTLELRSGSINLLKDVQLILLGLGVKSVIVQDDIVQDGGAVDGGEQPGRRASTTPLGREDSGDANTRHGLRIDPGSLRLFAQHAGLLPGHKADRLDALLDRLPITPDLDGNYDAFARLEPVGRMQVFDLTEPVTSSFVAGGITVHNCSEYMFLDDTACNLASLNVLTFFDAETRSFDIDAYRHSVRLWTIVLEISVLMASFPSEEIAQLSYQFRTLGLGYANLGAMLMQAGIAYDSDRGRAICAALSSILTGESYTTSAEMAAQLGPFPGFGKNRDDMLRVIRNHRRAAYGATDYESLDIHPQKIDAGQFDDNHPLASSRLLHASRECWDHALQLGEKHGYRNAQTTVIAPTGCLVGNSLVSTDLGLMRLNRLGDVNGARWQDASFNVLTDDGEREATKFFVNGIEATRKVRTAAGYFIQGTLKHRVKVVDPATGVWEWKRFADIVPGDVVPLAMGKLVGDPRPVTLPPLGEVYWTGDYTTRVPRDMTPELAEFLGYFMGDGSLHARGLRLCVANTALDVADRLVSLTKSLFNLDAHVAPKEGYAEVAVHSVALVIWWEACGFDKLAPSPEHTGKGYVPRIPDALLASNDPAVYGAFLRGLFEADGCVIAGMPMWTTAQGGFADDVRTMLLALGLPTSTKHDISGWGQGTLHVLRLRNSSYAGAFTRLVGFMGARKRSLMREQPTHEQAARYDYVHVPADVVEELVPVGAPLANAVTLSRKRNGGAITRRSAETLFAETADPRIGHALGFFFDTVESNDDGGEQPTFDLSVPDNVTYVANGFVSHNTIGLLMDCDTTGVEPDFALVKFKKLAGGGYFKIANQSVRPALVNLGYTPDQIHDILKYVMGTMTLHDAPHVNWLSLKAHGLNDADLQKIEQSLPGQFELGFAFSGWSLGQEAMDRLKITEAEWQSPKFQLLKKLGFTRKQIDGANDVICGRGTVEGAPHLKPEHYSVFDCANKCGRHGTRFIHADGHIRMMAAAQPFITGAISKTINLPNEATVEQIKQSYQLSWELGLKSNALYRDGSKLSQPLNVKSDKDLDEVEEDDAENVASAKDEVSGLVASATLSVGGIKSDNIEATHVKVIEKIIERIVERPLRRRLPDTRNAITHKFDVAGHEGYITAGLYDNGQPGEVFITMAKEGSTIGGLMDAIATLVSVSLQYGVPVESLVRKFEHVRFEPSGMTRNPEIPMAKSLVDYIFRWLAMEFVPGYRETNAPQRSPAPARRSTPAPAAAEKPNGANGHGSAAEVQARTFTDSELKAAHSPKFQATESHDPGPTGPALRVALLTDPLSQQGTEMQADAPGCDVCGSITVRSGTCYKCLNCGNSMGCS